MTKILKNETAKKRIEHNNGNMINYSGRYYWVGEDGNCYHWNDNGDEYKYNAIPCK